MHTNISNIFSPSPLSLMGDNAWEKIGCLDTLAATYGASRHAITPDLPNGSCRCTLAALRTLRRHLACPASNPASTGPREVHGRRPARRPTPRRAARGPGRDRVSRRHGIRRPWCPVKEKLYSCRTLSTFELGFDYPHTRDIRRLASHCC